jgi:UDP:flavonoid glycosyltransferase YjiC (YdhE family)
VTKFLPALVGRRGRGREVSIMRQFRTAQLRAGLVLRRPSRLRARRLVDQLVTDRTLEEDARDLSARLRPEHGAARAADAIEAALSR